MHRHITLVSLLTSLLAVVGCGGPPGPPLYPLTGTVTQGGKPVAGGGLIFIPESGEWGGKVISASVNSDGRFACTTSRYVGGKSETSDGLPAGRYRVTYHPPGNGEKLGYETELLEVVTVEAKDNVLTLDVPVGRTARELKEQAAKKDPQAPDAPAPEKK